MSMFVLFLFVEFVWSFNVDVKNSIVFQGLGEDNDLFGNSVSLMDTHCYVGAPGGNNGIGRIYICPFSSDIVGRDKRVCHVLKGGPNGDEAAALGLSMIRNENQTFTCAPLTSRERYRSIHANMGTCYKVSEEGVLKYITLQNFKTKLWSTDDNRGWRTASIMGEGLSVTSQGELVIGVPLARCQEFAWTSERVTGSIGVVRKLDLKDFVLTPPEKVLWTSRKHSDTEDPHAHDLTGTSIAKGNFFAEPGNHYVVGAPKANSLKGRVYFCRGCFDPFNSKGFERSFIDGEMIGARFGQTVIAININGDAFDDVIVGAPLFSHDDESYDTGEVYIYKTMGFATDHKFEKMPIKLERNIVNGAQFGLTLANLGDIDGDGFEDFAVAAPFEDAGVVYIYRGNQQFSISKYSQRITPEIIENPAMKGFGSSISQPRDVDGNGMVDMVIGAMYSGHAALLRSLPVIRISPRSGFQGSKLIEPSDNSFKLLLCATLEKPTLYPLNIQVSFPKTDSRIQYPIESGPVSIVMPQFRAVSCHGLKVHSAIDNFGVDKDNLTQIPNPLKLRANLVWKLDPISVCHPLGCPVFDPDSKTTEVGVPYDVELKSVCKDRICNCKLDFNALSFVEYVVGQNDRLPISFSIKNIEEEPAFNVRIMMTTQNTILKVVDEDSRRCQVEKNPISEHDSSMYECNLGVLQSHQSRDYTIHFDVSNPSLYLNDTFDLNLNLESSCAFAPLKPNHVVKILVKRKMDLEVRDVSRGSEDLDYDKNTVKDFRHSFTLSNHGPSPTALPVRFMVGIPISEVQDNSRSNLIYDGSRMNCQATRMGVALLPVDTPFSNDDDGISSHRVACDTDDCLTYLCIIKPGWIGSTTVFAKMRFQLDSTRTDYTLRYRILTYLRIPDSNLGTYSVTIFDSLHRAQIKYLYEFILPLVGGILIGLLLLTVLFIILWRTGTFSKMRIYKKKLQEVEQERRILAGGTEGGPQS